MSQGAKGGAISITGDAVKISAATLDASGETGGGSLLIGGGPQGLGPLAHAQTVSIASGAMLTASATQNGDGGQIVAWSDNSTTVAGTLTAQGGELAQGGTSRRPAISWTSLASPLMPRRPTARRGLAARSLQSDSLRDRDHRD